MERKAGLLLLCLVCLGAIHSMPPALLLMTGAARLEYGNMGIVVVPALKGGAFSLAASLCVGLVLLVASHLVEWADGNRTSSWGHSHYGKGLPAKLCLVGCAVGLGLYLVGNLVYGIKVPVSGVLQGMGNRTAIDVILTVVALVVVTPLLEEMFFRGVLLRVLSSLTGKMVGAIAAAVLFAYAHGAGRLFVFYVAAGLAFTLLQGLSRSLLPSICAHAVFNALVVIAVVFK